MINAFLRMWKVKWRHKDRLRERVLCGLEAGSDAQVSPKQGRDSFRGPWGSGAPLASCLWNLQRTHSCCWASPSQWFFATEDLGYSDTGEGLCRGLYWRPSKDIYTQDKAWVIAMVIIFIVTIVSWEEKIGQVPVFLWRWACFCVYFWKTWKYSKVALGARTHTPS